MRKQRFIFRVNKTSAIKAINDNFGNIKNAAKSLGIDRESLYNFIKRHELHLVVENARDQLVDIAENSLLELVRAKDVRAVIFVLSTLGKKRGYTTKLDEMGATGGHNVTVVFTQSDKTSSPSMN